jgi:hypothetical protein
MDGLLVLVPDKGLLGKGKRWSDPTNRTVNNTHEVLATHGVMSPCWNGSIALFLVN